LERGEIKTGAKMNINNPIEKFKSFMAEHGFFPPDVGFPDEFVRFNRNGKRDKSAWCVRFDDPPAGAVGDWRTGEIFTWSGISQNSMSDAEREAFRQRMQQAQDARKKAQAEAQAKAAGKARQIWTEADSPASQEHPYLKRKGLKPVGDIKQYGKALVVPVRAFDGALHSLQFIGADGSKKFLTDGKVQGHCTWIKGEGITLVCEGWATGASLHMATGFNLVCAFNAGNIGPAVEALLQEKPGIEVVVCCDNDAWLETNVGIEKGQEVARKHGLKMAIPTFKDVSSKPTDFDDLRRLEGIEAVRLQIEGAKVPIENPPEAWPEPEPIQETLPPVLPLVDEMIPRPFLPMVKDEAHRMSVPPDYIAIPLVVVCGSLVGTGCRILPKRRDDWMVVPNLWGGLIGPPSRLKSPAMDAVIKKLLGRLEAEAAQEHQEAMESWADDKRKAELSKSVLEAEYKQALKSERAGRE
jgi:putative DNA primase/helicase